VSKAQSINFVFTGSSQSQRLDQAILSHLVAINHSAPSRSRIQEWIKNDQVRINGVVTRKPGVLLKSGVAVDCVISSPQPQMVEGEAIHLTVLYEDEDLLVINKQAGLTVHPGAGQRSGTLLNGLVRHLGGGAALVPGVRPWIVHRLDRDTSGVLLVAKNDTTHRVLSQQFQERSVEKEYVALCYLTPRRLSPLVEDTGTIQSAIGRSPRDRTKMAVVPHGGRSAVTHWRVLERFLYGAFLSVTIETGRTHQIRVHLSSMGAPLIGDQSYGDTRGLPDALYRLATQFGRQALHARRISFTHPTSAEPVSFEAPLPDDLTSLIETWRRYE
jgi:23S rRNA pseudouridine1911/1915/1917 synthase